MPKILAETEVDVIVRMSVQPRYGRGWRYDVGSLRKRWQENPQAQEEGLVAVARDAQDLIKQHVYPHNDYIDGMDLKIERHFECEHCRSRWTEASDKYNGGCCAKDEDGNPEAVTQEDRLGLTDLEPTAQVSPGWIPPQ